MIKVFIDTSYLLALELAQDQHHTLAVQHWKQALLASQNWVTTSYVLDEVVTFFNSRGHHAKAVNLGNTLLQSPSVQLVHIDESLFYQGWHYFQHHYDKRYSLTDCISFVTMKAMKITTAYTFDHHFVQAGFVKAP